MEKALSNINGLELYKNKPGEDLDEAMIFIYLIRHCLPYCPNRAVYCSLTPLKAMG